MKNQIYITQTHPNRGTISINNINYNFSTNSQVLPGVSSSRKQVFTCDKLRNNIYGRIEFSSLDELVNALLKIK